MKTEEISKMLSLDDTNPAPTPHRRNTISAQSIFSVETPSASNRMSQLLGLRQHASERSQSSYCNYGFIALDINNFTKHKFDLSNIFMKHDTIEHFHMTHIKAMHESLKSCIIEIISMSTSNEHEKDVLLRNMKNNHYYITILVNEKHYQLQDDNMARYFRYCRKKHIVPFFRVHFLSILTRRPSMA